MWPYTTEEATWPAQPAEWAVTASPSELARRAAHAANSGGLARPLPLPANDHPANDDGIRDPQVILCK
ncbi:MAG: hypothetical protein ACREEP_00370 [Dongiaceae bacterium]